ncbi:MULTISPECIES: DUF5642 family protein [Mycobacterium]|uniref:DUF5642 family protein n=1 Tax=Mycobacterium TaxID=1763 RepID=UPI001041BD40|nr:MULTISPECIES: DUF5642 family protein [Mycobacterium]MCG7608219.1 DUF5642 family protein [Mycobacterium sp. CnD-18-1]TMS53724.1 hypothetical protein E0T84_10420 [Mycobacterium sp. DBP42]
MLKACGHGVVAALVLLAGSLAGCSTSETLTSGSPAASPDASPPPVDLARLADLKDDFPPGLTPEPAAPTKVGSKWAYLVGDIVSSGKPFNVDPPACRSLLQPVTADGDADKAGIGAGGPQPPLLGVGVTTPVSVPVPLPPTDCDRMTFEVEGAVPDGTVERLSAPTVDRATTYGLKVIYDAGVEYHYVAILDGRTYVEVVARMAPDFQPDPLLPDLLTKAVTAIRR